MNSASDADSVYAYTYDPYGNRLTASNSGTPGVPTVVIETQTNDAGRRNLLRTTIAGAQDMQNTYSYDGLHRRLRVEQTGWGGTQAANKGVDFEYDAAGRLTKTTRQYKPAGAWLEAATSTFSYDTLDRLTALDHKKGAANIANYTWQYDFMDRVTQFVGPDGTSNYTYDAESELTGADQSYQTDETYTFDATGNRTITGYSTGTNNRLLSDGTYNYTYDDEGNRTVRTKISNNSVTEYTWDHRNRLTKVVERPSAGGAITKEAEKGMRPFIEVRRQQQRHDLGIRWPEPRQVGAEPASRQTILRI